MQNTNKKKTAIIVAAVLVIWAVVAIVAIMSKGGFSKENPTNSDNVAQTRSEYTDEEAQGEVYVTENNSVEIDSSTDASVTVLTVGQATESASEQTSKQNVEKTTKKATEKVTEHKVSEGERLYLEAEKALKNGNTKKAAILFGKSSNYGYSDARKRSFALWDKVAARETISAGAEHTVGLKSGGTVVVVGKNDYGQCNVDGWSDIVAVSAGYYHTVGLKSDGTVVAVGNNGSHQCDIDGWTDIVAVSVYTRNTVGLKADGTVVAVGDNSYGQCDVDGWTDIVAVAAGWYHTVGLKSDGTVVAVGYNEDGRINVDSWKNIKIPK